MTIDPTQHPALLMPPAGRVGPGPAGAQGFTSLLTRSSSQAQQAGRSPEAQVRQTIEQFVSSAFMMPLMNELRKQPLDSDLLDGGFAEDSFRQQLDTIIADRIVSGSNFPIVDEIYRRVMQNVPGEQAPAAAQLDLAA